ncbi:AMP-binding protein [Nocardiopsis sp. L17-MgMaSL7]|uniref:AMP-binding protein n=1 Tax=Nocardiopsis sp. L17-MgMaSL7 TaxID=1938893 RepID=UPI000D70C6F5|nr:AMP-binding protein [Nocardiopsis sp. L17-MgMaSL7]PWV46787.1 long-subunit acyl-CoA synthetase (AMP-forming) [Nocardiopsis sp. L17-MgMaSL7]
MGETPGSLAREHSGLSDLIYEVATTDAHAHVFSVLEGRDWERRTAGEFATEVTALAKGLVAAGVAEGDRVLLVADSHHDWVRFAFAVWSVRAVLVPLPRTASAERVQHVVRETRPAAAVVEGERQYRTAVGLQRELPDLGRVWRYEEGLPVVAGLGTYMDASAVRFRRDEVVADDPAVVLYPMSTVSRRTRGVVLSHGALLTAAADLVDRMWPRLSELAPGRASAVLDLPMSELPGLASLVACVVGRVRVGLVAPGRLRRELDRFRPTVLVCRPHLFERVHGSERATAHSTDWDSVGTFNAAMDAAVSFDQSPKKGAWRRLSRSMYDWSFSKIRDMLGGRVHLAVCWGGGLTDRLDSYFSGVGVPVMQVFGVPETAGVFVANAPGERVAGSVGQAMPGREVWVSREGELFVRGGAVFLGYWADGEGSRSAFREGWLATGVLAEEDAEGFVRVRGRVRPQASVAEVPGRFVPRANVLDVVAEPETEVAPGVVATASLPVVEAPTRELEVAPAVGSGGSRGESSGTGEFAAVGDGSRDADVVAGFEARLRSHPLISQVLVIVEGRPFASALVTLVRDQLEYWRLVNGRPLSMAPEEIAGDRDLLREVQGLVYEANRSVPRHLAVRSFHVLAEEFTVQSGLVRPSGELRREAVLRAFSEEIDGLYRVRRE